MGYYNMCNQQYTDPDIDFNSDNCDKLPKELQSSCKLFKGMYWNNPLVQVEELDECPIEFNKFSCWNGSGSWPTTCPEFTPATLPPATIPAPLLPPLPTGVTAAPLDSSNRVLPQDNTKYATTTMYWDCSAGSCGCGFKPPGKDGERDPPFMCPWNAFGNPGSTIGTNGETIYLGTAAVSAQLFGEGDSTWQGTGCGKCYKLTSTGQCGQEKNMCGYVKDAGGKNDLIMLEKDLPDSLKQYAGKPIPLNIFGGGKTIIVKATNACPDQPICPLNAK